MSHLFYFPFTLFLVQLHFHPADSAKLHTGTYLAHHLAHHESGPANISKLEKWGAFCNNPKSIRFLEKILPRRGSRFCKAEPAPNADDPLYIPSLFPEHVPPSIHFVTKTTKENLLKRRLLFSTYRWIDSKSPAVDIVMTASGLQLAPLSLSKYLHCLGFINVGAGKGADKFLPQNFVLKHSGKYSQMANSTTLDFKVNLIRNFRRFEQKFPHTWGDWHLPAYILPDEKAQFLSVFRSDIDKEWIYKPSTTANSFGIKLVNLNDTNLGGEEENPAIIQKHLENPFLLGEAKIEPRFFVLVTSIHPLRMFIYNNSYFKLLHNYESVMWAHRFDNKSYPIVYEKKTFENFWPVIEAAGFSVDTLKQEIYDLIVKSVMMGEAEMWEASKTLPIGSTFQHFSIDFMWNRGNMKPYLIEINRFPWLSYADTWPAARRHLADMLTVVGFKTHLSAGDTTTRTNVSDECDRIISDNADLDVRDGELMSLIEGEDELNRLKYTGYTRLFPTNDTAKYFKYVESDTRAYKLQHKWESRFGSDRGEGVRYLQCRLNRSLDKGSQKNDDRESDGD